MNLIKISRAGFSLVETVLALGVAAFCLATIFALLPIGMNSNKSSSEQTVATNMLTSIAADLRATPNPANSVSSQISPVFGFSIPANATTGSVPTVPALTPSPTATYYISANGTKATNASAIAAARYQLNIWLTPSVGKRATLARLLLTWPANATVANAAGSVETVIALDRTR
jgi:uncharacterized protein (TIGR02598 family)